MFRFALLISQCFLFLLAFGQSNVDSTVENVAALANIVGSARINDVYVKGYSVAGDGGEGEFLWNDTSTKAVIEGMIVKSNGSLQGRWMRKYDPTLGVNIRWLGADAQGVVDASNAIIAAHKIGPKVIYPIGRYKFTSAVNPNLTSGIIMESGAHIDGLKFRDVVTVDEDPNKVIGLQHNHLEQSNVTLGTNAPITTGYILAPLLSTKQNNEDVLLIAHWYNDFGLEKTRSANGAAGSLTWYYWSWAFTNNSSGYDPSRHPLLGWYRGDNVNVLDWQCYWLREYGICGVNLVGTGIDITKWQTPSNKDYWIYQLFTNVKNFKGLKYIMWGFSGPSKPTYTTKQIENNWISILNNFHKKYNNYFSITKNGKVYPVIYLFEADMVRGVFDNYNGNKNLKAFLARMGDRYRKAGFGGLCIFARHPTRSLSYTTLESKGVLYLPAEYSRVDGVSSATTYEDYVNGFAVPTYPAIVNIVTSHESKPPHPSGWTQTGSTPQLFEALLSKAVNAVRSADYLPKVIQIYNVAEWAEGGPGLQPNVRDGFDYLQAVRNVMKVSY